MRSVLDGVGGQVVSGLGVRLVLDAVGGQTADRESKGLPPMLLESDGHMQEVTEVKLVSSLFQVTANGSAKVLLTNHLNQTQTPGTDRDWLCNISGGS